MVESTAVLPEGRITHGCLGLYSEENQNALTQTIHIAKKFSSNTIFGIQLAHAGAKGSAQRPWEGGQGLKPEEHPWIIKAPSSIPFDTTRPAPKALILPEMERILEAFVSSAKQAAAMGFQVIELQCAHGYLLHQFLASLTNQRKDAYGGSLENRIRFPLEIAKAVRRAVSPEIAIGARISGTDWVKDGVTIEEAIVFASKLNEQGIDYVCVSTGGLSPRQKIQAYPNYQVPFAARVKKEAQIHTRAVGMILTPQQAEEIIRSDQADCVALARSFLNNPRWAWHAADALEAKVYFPSQYAFARPPRWYSPMAFQFVSTNPTT